MKDIVMSKNAFVKREQEKMMRMMGKRPGVPAEMEKFNAYMSNDGEAAERACQKVTKGLDDAFPVDYVGKDNL